MRYRLLFFIFIIISCASTDNFSSNSLLEKRSFLKENRKYTLTYGENNPALDSVIDNKAKWIYYTRESSGNTDIFAIDSYTLKSYRLTKSPAIDSSVSIDNKSKYLVFTSTRDDAYGDIYLYKLVNLFGIRHTDLENLEQNIVRLTDYRGYDIDPVISHNSDTIAFISDREDFTKKLYTMKVNGKDIKKISDLEASSPSFSFDDKHIVFVTSTDLDNASQLVLVDTDNTNNTIYLTDSDRFKFNPTFYNNDSIVYFEIDSDTDRDGSFTYADKRRLMLYSISTKKSYVLEEDTKLRSFDVADSSLLVGSYVISSGNTSIVTFGSTKDYFIKDDNANEMYSNFSTLTFDKKTQVVDRFAEYFPEGEDSRNVSKAYFDIMTESYTNNNIDIYNTTKNILINNYSNTFFGFLANKTEYIDDTNYNWVIFKNYTNSDIFTNNNIENFISYTAYILANEKTKNNYNEDALLLLNKVLSYNSNKDLYILISKLYLKLLESVDSNISEYDIVFNRKDLSFNDKLIIAKDFIKDTDISYDFIIENTAINSPLSLASRLKYVDGLIVSKDYDLALELFAPYLNLENYYKAYYHYINALISLSKNNEDVYLLLKDSIKVGGNIFASTSEGLYAKRLLSDYYSDIANEAYKQGRYNIAYDNYKEVLIYDPNNLTASSRIIESGLRGYSSIESLENTIKERENLIIKTKYSDHKSHYELANAYYYLANRYYSIAISKQNSADRYEVAEKKREDGFYLYLNKSFNTVLEKSLSYINFAIFLYPDDVEYYIKKAEMLTFADALKTQVLQEDKTYKSIIELVPSYVDNNVTNENYIGFNTLPFLSYNIETDIINTLLIAKSRSDANSINIMLANAFLINGRYSDALWAYSLAEKYIDNSNSDKSRAWYHFFYGYSLWMNDDFEGAYREYNKSRVLFEKLKDVDNIYKIIGYIAIAAIENKDYNKAIDALLERNKFSINSSIKDTELNDLLIAACYLKLEDYNNALKYCDNIKSKIDSLDTSLYTPNYVRATIYGANVNVVNLGLASFGGYIPGEPLNVDKQQMLYSLYQDLYEKMGRYSQSREALEAYKDYILKDKPKKSIQPLMLATYYNNEGYLYYKQGSTSNAISSFIKSINEYKNSLNSKDVTNNPNVIYENAQNDVKNYLSLSSLYLRYLSQNELTNIKRVFFTELFRVAEHINVLSTNPKVSSKDRLLLYTHIAALQYILAFKLTADNSVKIAREVNKDDPTDLRNHDINYERLKLLKDAIDRYKYILSSKSDFPVDLKTEIIIRYNLAKAYELAGYIEEASREYTSAYLKAKVSSFVVEEIAILTSLIDFSKKYRDKYPDSLDYPVQYVYRMLERIRSSVFMITFVEDNSFILEQAKYKAIEFLKSDYPEASVSILSMFDAIDMRKEFLDKRILNLGDNNIYLEDYYKLYEEALYTYQKYLSAVSSVYDKKLESETLKKIEILEKEAIKKFTNTPIENIVLCNLIAKNLYKKLRNDETLIWDTYFDYRFVVENNGVKFYYQTNSLLNTKNYISHISFNHKLFNNTNKDVFVRELYDATEYMLPKKSVYIDKRLIALSRADRAYREQFSKMTNENNTNNIRKRNSRYDVIELESINTNAYSPLFIDISTATVNEVSYINKNLYIVYADKSALEQSKELLKNANAIAFIVGNSNFQSRLYFYSNYFNKLQTNSIEEAMKGFDTSLLTFYGTADLSIKDLENDTIKYKNKMYDLYKKDVNPSFSVMSNLIAYSTNYNEKMSNYATIVEDRYNAFDTNNAYFFAEEGYQYLWKNYTNISEDNAYRFIKSMLPIFKNMGEEGAIKGANRALHFVYLYTNSNYSLIDEYFTPKTLSYFLKAKKDKKEASAYLNYIAPKVKGEYRNKILELALLYNKIYAKNDNITNIIDMTENSDYILNIVDTILDKNSTNQKNIFMTMDYIYANEYMFEANTISEFADRFYARYRQNPTYIFGLLNKIRNPESNFTNNIVNAYNILKQEDTNTMFIYYTLENNKYVAYSYLNGDKEIKKISLAETNRVNNYLYSFVNATSSEDRVNALNSIENIIINSSIAKDSKNAKTIYITSSYDDIFFIPFAYIPSFKSADVIKVREFKYIDNSNILDIGNIDIKQNISNSFYTQLETLAINNYKNNNKINSKLIHYIGTTTNKKPFDNNDIFLSPATQNDIYDYLSSKNNTKVMFTYNNNNIGDYYTVLKSLYSHYDDNIIDAYRYIKNNTIKANIIKNEDKNILYQDSYTLFDYILPAIIK